MIYLCLFLAGFLFATIIMPILDVLSTWIQNIVGLHNVRMQKEAEEITNNEEKPIHAIGFSTNANQIEEVEYDE